MGKFTLTPLSECTNVPDSVKKKRGGFVVPVLQREAISIAFSSKNGKAGAAIKVSMGGALVSSRTLEQGEQNLGPRYERNLWLAKQLRHRYDGSHGSGGSGLRHLRRSARA